MPLPLVRCLVPAPPPPTSHDAGRTAPPAASNRASPPGGVPRQLALSSHSSGSSLCSEPVPFPSHENKAERERERERQRGGRRSNKNNSEQTYYRAPEMAAPAPKQEELQPHAVRDQLPSVSYCLTSPPPWRTSFLPSPRRLRALLLGSLSRVHD